MGKLVDVGKLISYFVGLKVMKFTNYICLLLLTAKTVLGSNLISRIFRRLLRPVFVANFIVLLGLGWNVAVASETRSLLTLSSAIEEALRNHPQLAIGRSDMAAAQFEVDAADWGFWPTLGVRSEAVVGGYSVTATVEQPLWSGGRLTGQAKASNARYD